uniref:Uncharacterized protein n=1 Tax=Caenorhabditis japonica TaxID=281687 RepID=A0A8R1EGS7_CAEJA
MREETQTAKPNVENGRKWRDFVYAFLSPRPFHAPSSIRDARRLDKALHSTALPEETQTPNPIGGAQNRTKTPKTVKTSGNDGVYDPSPTQPKWGELLAKYHQ